MDCLFCKIANGQIPAKIVCQDEQVMAFNDLHPQATHHLLIIPKQHISTLNDLRHEDTALIGHMVQSAVKLAKQLKLADDGYRLVMNCNQHGGQTIFHIHIHLLGGRPMTWPPG